MHLLQRQSCLKLEKEERCGSGHQDGIVYHRYRRAGNPYALIDDHIGTN